MSDRRSEPGASRETQRGPTSKVARVLSTYDLDGLGAELERRWLGDGRDSESLRELAELVNRRVLERAMVEAGMNPIQGEVANLYSLLVDDDVTEGAQMEAVNTLERSGVDTDGLLDDFVSHQAVHTYLRKYRGVSKDAPDGSDRIESTTQAIERLRGRLSAVTERNVDSLQSTDRIDLGSFDVLVNVNVVCEDCNRQYDVFELLNRGSCDCQGD